MKLYREKDCEILGIPNPTIHENLWWEAWDWAEQRGCEEGDIDPDYDEDILEAWQEKHYEWLCEQEGVEPYVYDEGTSCSGQNHGSEAE